MAVVLGIDLGTSSVKAMLLDTKEGPLAVRGHLTVYLFHLPFGTLIQPNNGRTDSGSGGVQRQTGTGPGILLNGLAFRGSCFQQWGNRCRLQVPGKIWQIDQTFRPRRR